MPVLTLMNFTSNPEGIAILLKVHDHYKNGGIDGRSRDDDAFGCALQVNPSVFQGSQEPSQLHNILSTHLTPFDIDILFFLEDGYRLSIDVKFPFLGFDFDTELAIEGIKL